MTPNEKPVSKKDPAIELWENFPDISSLSFIVRDAIYVVETTSLPEEFLKDLSTLDLWDFNHIDLKDYIQRIWDSGGESRVRILLLILEQLMKQVDGHTYVYYSRVGEYSEIIPASVWYEVREWIITHFREIMSNDEIDELRENYRYKYN